MSEQTFWESCATTRWGRYLTSIEQTTIQFAHDQFETPTDALEVGCEGGRWSQMLTDLGWSITATDINEETLAVCQRRLPDANCILVSKDDRRFPVDDESCDLLLSIEVTVGEEPWFLDEIARVLRPGGTVVCTFNNLNSYRGRLSNVLASIRREDPYYGYSYRFCKNRLEEHGLEFQQETGFAWCPFPRKSNSSLIPMCTNLERMLGLRRLPSLSPLVIAVARKQAAKK